MKKNDYQLTCEIICNHNGLKKYDADKFDLVSSISLDEREIEILRNVLRFTSYSISGVADGKFCFRMYWDRNTQK